mgnify:CR=1 FL=1
MSELITGQKRSARCTEFTEADVGKNVTVMGWVDTRRDMGKIIFVDLRDRSGIIQVVIDDRVSAEDFEKAKVALKQCNDWYRPKGTGKIYSVNIDVLNDKPKLEYKA